MQLTDQLTQNSYSIVITEDGSPSLFWRDPLLTLQSDQGTQNHFARGEMMHHKGGALSESREIYGKVVAEGLAAGLSRIVSIGLGLGYNELLVAHYAWRNNIHNIRLLSYESDSFLSESFLNFLAGSRTAPLDRVYLQILELIDADNWISVCRTLEHWHQAGSWLMAPALAKDTLPTEKYEIVLYDAFSSKTSPQLWSEEFLIEFLDRVMAAKSLFSTYACTGALKRSLKARQFELVIREGFHGKRNSTLGRRGF